ncbi:MAG: CYTH domain-containing protein [Bacteroidales bacterium]|nr:CYTH domain-containing protein [Bacteroidales bacterium]
MALEIERKFLVVEEKLPPLEAGLRMVQAYLTDAHNSVTLRIRQAGDKAWLTVKGRNDSIARPEFEYQIPPSDVPGLMALAVTPPVIKTRKTICCDGKKWEIDFFEGANAGLVLAEIELADVAETVSIPEWVGREVSGIARYYNSCLAVSPYSEWNAADREGT